MKHSFKVIDTGIKNPDISIAMITYNHGKYIGHAIESVLSQKINYSYKIVIAEDFSTDNTRKIILDYQQKYPHLFELILQDNNVGARINNYDLLSNLNGKYIAALEGDDYWTDPYKLQKQVDFLEASPEYSGCCHNAMLVFEDGSTNNELYNNEIIERNFNIADLINSGINCPIATASLLFRRDYFAKELDNEFINLAFGDKPIEILVAKYGPIKYFPEVMSAYRKHSGSFTATFNWEKFSNDYSSFFKYIDSKLNYDYHSLIQEQLKQVYLNCAHHHTWSGNRVKAKESIYYLRPLLNYTDYLKPTVVKLFLKYYFPILLKLKVN